jgi:hypothetical protein
MSAGAGESGEMGVSPPTASPLHAVAAVAAERRSERNRRVRESIAFLRTSFRA